MKIYIAAPYPERLKAIALGRTLALDGHTITARWLAPSHDADDKGPTLTEWARHAREDLTDVLDCDLLIAYNPDGYENVGTGGRHVELGYALAINRRILLIGDRTNTFHHLGAIKQIDQLGDFRQAVAAIEAEEKEAERRFYGQRE